MLIENLIKYKFSKLFNTKILFFEKGLLPLNKFNN